MKNHIVCIDLFWSISNPIGVGVGVGVVGVVVVVVVGEW